MSIKSISRISVTALFLGMIALQSHAAIPLQINHQGFIDVGGTAFNGNGDFRYALVDPDTGFNVWTNDASGIGTSTTPTAAVSLPVINGIYNVRLGDTTVPNMTAITSALFNDDNLELRVWFDDGTNGTQVLSPDQPLTSAPYTMHAAVADIAATATTALTANSATTATTAANADQVDGMEGADLEESAEIDADIAAASASHDSDVNAHGNILLDGSNIATGTIANARLNTGSGNGLDADTVDGAHAAALEESTEIDSDISTHNTTTGAHANIQLDGTNIATGTIANARLNTGSGNGLDADTVDGAHAAALEESTEIDSDISTHNTTTGAHANIQLDASNITSGLLAGARINQGSGSGLDADTVDGLDAAELVDGLDAAAMISYRATCIVLPNDAISINVLPGEIAIPNAGETDIRFRRNTTETAVNWSNLDTGSEANDTQYYVYATADSAAATTFDVTISVSASAPTGVSYSRLIGFFYNDSSGDITDVGNMKEGNADNWLRVKGTSSASISGTGPYEVIGNDMDIHIVSTGRKVFITFTAPFFKAVASGNFWVQVFVDGVGTGQEAFQFTTTNVDVSLDWVGVLTPGAHRVTAEWLPDNISFQQRGGTDGPRILTVEEK